MTHLRSQRLPTVCATPLGAEWCFLAKKRHHECAALHAGSQAAAPRSARPRLPNRSVLWVPHKGHLPGTSVPSGPRELGCRRARAPPVTAACPGCWDSAGRGPGVQVHRRQFPGLGPATAPGCAPPRPHARPSSQAFGRAAWGAVARWRKPTPGCPPAPPGIQGRAVPACGRLLPAPGPTSQGTCRARRPAAPAPPPPAPPRAAPDTPPRGGGPASGCRGRLVAWGNRGRRRRHTHGRP